MEEPNGAPELNSQPASKPNTNTAPAPPKTEDDLFQNATQNIELDQAPASQPLPTKKSSKKKLIFPLLIVLLLVGAAVGWYFFMREKPADTTSQQPAPVATEEAAPTYEPNTVAYAYRAKDSDPNTVYTRPAEGGDRKQAIQLNRDAYIGSTDAVGAYAAFMVENIVYASTDHGATYTKIYEGAAGTSITDLIIDNDGTGIVFGLLDTKNTKNEVISIDFAGKNKKTVFNNSQPGVILLGWSSKNNRIVFQSVSTWNSDGGDYTTYTYDTATSTRKEILEDVDEDTIGSISASGDASQIIYITGVVDTQAEGPGRALIAPYTVSTFDVNTGKSTEVSTVGKAGEKNSNGTTMYRAFFTGFMEGTNTPHYATGKKLYLIKNNEQLLFYESTRDLVHIEYVSDKHVIVGSGEYGNFILTNYTVESKKTATVLEGDANTILIGVTTD